jgi:hypothetical protein
MVLRCCALKGRPLKVALGAGLSRGAKRNTLIQQKGGVALERIVADRRLKVALGAGLGPGVIAQSAITPSCWIRLPFGAGER